MMGFVGGIMMLLALFAWHIVMWLLWPWLIFIFWCVVVAVGLFLGVVLLIGDED